VCCVRLAFTSERSRCESAAAYGRCPLPKPHTRLHGRQRTPSHADSLRNSPPKGTDTLLFLCVHCEAGHPLPFNKEQPIDA
jgi:hypothetical protein